MKSFAQRLTEAFDLNRSLLCVGLDPDPRRMPIGDVAEFNRAIVDATRDLVCAYKPNLAFYEALGMPGLEALARTVGHIRSVAPGVVVIGDAKRGDIADTNAAYATAMFDVWGFDAATVNCYAGGEALEPFLRRPDRGVFVWCRSSNPGAVEFQDLEVAPATEGAPLFERVARRASQWRSEATVGLVVGATYPAEVGRVRALCPAAPLLVPGVGAQGGDLAESVRCGVDAGGRGLLIAASRGVIYASGDRSDFARTARKAAESLNARIARALEEQGKGW